MTNIKSADRYANAACMNENNELEFALKMISGIIIE
jgi:hypothetical protein